LACDRDADREIQKRKIMQNQRKNLLIVLIFSIVVTSFHYTDNAIFIDKYPEPEWFTMSGVYVTWIVLTLLGIAGYWLYQQEKFWAAYLCLGVYSFTGLSSPAHYFYGPMSEFSFKMHTLIGFDVLAGTLVLGFVLWSGLLLKEWQKVRL
jgi:hypothetical protein